LHHTWSRKAGVPLPAVRIDTCPITVTARIPVRWLTLQQARVDNTPVNKSKFHSIESHQPPSEMLLASSGGMRDMTVVIRAPKCAQ
jgi:hypothetical protein